MQFKNSNDDDLYIAKFVTHITTVDLKDVLNFVADVTQRHFSTRLLWVFLF